MSDENLDTKPLSPPVIEPTPDVAEGEPMPIEIPPGDDGLRSHVIKLTMRQTLIESKVEAIDARLAGFMTPKQIEEMYQRIADETVKRVETLKNDITSRFGEIQFSASQIQALNDKLNGIAEQLTQRSTEAAVDRKALTAVVRFINTLAADDVTDPDSKKSGKSWFDRMEESSKTSDERSLSAALEVSQWRVDAAEYMHEIKDGVAAVNAIAADLKPLALSVARAQALIDLGLRLAKRPRMAFGIFLAGLAAFGGGAVLTPELVKLIGNTIVEIVKVFSGVN